MNKHLLLIIISFFGLADSAFGYEIMVVKSSASKLNQQIQHIFFDDFDKHIPHQGLKSIQPNHMTEVVITKEAEDGYINIIQNSRPDLILALGTQALKVALQIPDIPIVHLLVVQQVPVSDTTRPVIGVSLSVPPKAQLEEMRYYFPEVKRIGIIYDPKRSQQFVKQLKAAKADLELVALATEDIAQVPDLIHSLQGEIDLLWMLPDLTVTNQMTIQNYVLFSIRNKIPLLTFSNKLLTHGATIAITFDTNKMAKQAAALAIEILSHRIRTKPAALIPPQADTIVNHKMAAKLGLSLPDKREEDE